MTTTQETTTPPVPGAKLMVFHPPGHDEPRRDPRQAQVLNPHLYQRLRVIPDGGVVHVANWGERMTGNYIRGSNGELRWVVSSWGETYRVNCPFCRDNRSRLWVNYRLGQPDPCSPHRMLTHFGVCYNEGCLQDPENRKRLVEMLFGVGAGPQGGIHPDGAVGIGVGLNQPLPPRANPGSCRPLISMSAEEPVVQYLVRRGFGFDVAQRFNLAFCDRGGDCPTATGRLIAPVTVNGIQVGWQGRSIDDKPSRLEPKYFTCPGMAKGRLLYNLDAVKAAPFVVVCEGVTDVWRLPDCGVALLGKSMSTAQQELLRAFGERPIAICLDADARADAGRHICTMVSLKQIVFHVRLPAGRDPASLEADALMATIHQQAQDAGIELGET